MLQGFKTLANGWFSTNPQLFYLPDFQVAAAFAFPRVL
jgi:hypothetical protein